LLEPAGDDGVKGGQRHRVNIADFRGFAGARNGTRTRRLRATPSDSQRMTAWNLWQPCVVRLSHQTRFH
jgi:hypothetical protein